MRRVIQKRIREQRDGLDLAADINAVIAVNTGHEDDQERPAEERPEPDTPDQGRPSE
jgi:hypothetical protein